MKIGIRKAWAVSFAFVWGLWAVIILETAVGNHIWTMKDTYCLILCAAICVFVLWITREEESLEV